MKYHRIQGEVIRVNDLSPSSSTHMPHKDEDDNESLLYHILITNPPDASDPLKRALPFQPLSYRDFMLFETHYYGAVMGMTKAFLLPAYYAAQLYHFVLPKGWQFPFFKPHKLWYQEAIFYQSNHLAFYSDGANIHYPKRCTYLDVELELGILLGKELYNATPEEALDAIAGFCVLNDFSARNLQMDEMKSGFGPQHSKGFANSVSSTVVTADEILGSLEDLKGRILVNDMVAAEPRVDKWQFGLGEALSMASRSTRLYPGEFFGSGTFPSGAGIEWANFEVRVGDTVVLEIEGIGSVRNSLVAEE